jgi:hypothetical protein
VNNGNKRVVFFSCKRQQLGFILGNCSKWALITRSNVINLFLCVFNDLCFDHDGLLIFHLFLHALLYQVIFYHLFLVQVIFCCYDHNLYHDDRFCHHRDNLFVADGLCFDHDNLFDHLFFYRKI